MNYVLKQPKKEKCYPDFTQSSKIKLMKKIRINMLSQATSVDGQGVGSAYIEQVALVKENDDIFEVEVNSKKSNLDILAK